MAERSDHLIRCSMLEIRVPVCISLKQHAIALGWLTVLTRTTACPILRAGNKGVESRGSWRTVRRNPVRELNCPNPKIQAGYMIKIEEVLQALAAGPQAPDGKFLIEGLSRKALYGRARAIGDAFQQAG